MTAARRLAGVSPAHIMYDEVCGTILDARRAVADIERLTITLPADMAAVVKGAVAHGD
jgi:hypothetical protein